MFNIRPIKITHAKMCCAHESHICLGSCLLEQEINFGLLLHHYAVRFVIVSLVGKVKEMLLIMLSDVKRPHSHLLLTEAQGEIQ